MHTAEGTEFPQVFIFDVPDEFIPLRRALR